MGVSSPKHVASGIFHEFDGFKHPKRCKTCMLRRWIGKCAKQLGVSKLTLPSTPHVFVDFGVLIPPNTMHKHDMIYKGTRVFGPVGPQAIFSAPSWC